MEFAAAADWLLPGSAETQPVDWSRIFELAGLNLEDFQSVAPVREPPMYADRLAAWETRPEGRRPIVVTQGATLAGRVVFFQAEPAAEDGETRGAAEIQPSLWRIPFRRLLLDLLAVFVAGSLAWYNLNTGAPAACAAHRVAVAAAESS